MSKIELGAKIAAIITAMVAVVVFAISVLDAQKVRYRDHVDVWRKAAIQRAFHEANGSTLNVSTLLEKLQSSAWKQEYDIQKDDLTEDEVRVLLVELISGGILRQLSNDTYRLRLGTEELDEDILRTVDALVKDEMTTSLPKVMEEYIDRPDSVVTSKSEVQSLSEELQRISRNVGETLSGREIFHLGDINCNEVLTRDVPIEGTSTDDWLVFGIPHYVTAAAEGSQLDGDNAIYQFATTVKSNGDKSGWEVRFQFLLNYNTKSDNDSIGNCNKNKKGEVFPHTPSSVRIVALKK